MSIHLLMNNIRLQAMRTQSRKTSSRYATVVSFNPNNYSAQCQIEPESSTGNPLYTGPIPVATPWAGNGWGMFAPPTAGNQVVIEFVDGDLTSGFVLAPFFNAATLPIQTSPQPMSGEFWLVHAKGQFLKLTNDGHISFGDNHGASVAMDGAGNIASAGTWTHTGNFTATGTITGNTDVLAGSNNVSVVNHTHPVDGIAVGSSNINTNAPNP